MKPPTYDPYRYIGFLQQTLSGDKRPLGFFLGAGCPMSIRRSDGAPLIPDIKGITEAVHQELSKNKECQASLKILMEHFVAL
jgi:hypothetical protein